MVRLRPQRARDRLGQRLGEVERSEHVRLATTKRGLKLDHWLAAFARKSLRHLRQLIGRPTSTLHDAVAAALG